MFFGRATSGFSAMFSTHPPIAERIRRIDPSWDGTLPASVPQVDAGLAPQAVPGAAGFAAGAAVEQAVASIGQPSQAHIRYAARLIESLPPDVVAAAHEPYGARAVVYALLLDRQPDTRRRQLSHLQAAADRGVFEETARLTAFVAPLDARTRLPLLEITLPALRALTAAQYGLFKQNVVALVEADDRIDLFEWSLHRILLHDLEAHHGQVSRARVRHRSIASVAPQCHLLLSLLAYVGHRDAEAASHAFERAWSTLELAQARLLRPDACGLGGLDAALGHLDDAAPQVKRQVIEAAVACITDDRQVTAAEAELLRAVSASMSCPMPPIMLD